jgi:DNA repair protein RecN (Recombination protein N)
VEEVAALDPGARELADRVRGLAEEARDAAAALRSYEDGLDLDPSRLDEVRERIAALRDLERKYGEGEEAVLAYLEEARGKLTALEGADQETGELQAEAARLDAEVRELAAALSARRHEVGPELGERLQAELQELGMPGARVEVVLREQDPGPDGGDAAVLRFAGGPGQTPQPFQKVASGGELSRTMLACRTILADLDRVPTLVFDEVDAGIGGRAGVAVGRRLAQLAATRQVLVVTHLPQIACFADRHFRVSKARARTAVEPLEGPSRVEELSRMLSGMPTEEAATHAEQLLAEAAREKGG